MAAALVAVGVLAFTRTNTGSTPPSAAPASSTTTSSSTSPSPSSTTATSAAAPLVQPDQLQDFLLPVDDVSVAVGNPTPPMRAGKTETALISDGQYTPAECASTYGPAIQSAYAKSDYTGVAAQAVNQGADGKNRVIQAAISFPSAQDAHAYYEQTFAQWQKCAGQFVTANILDLPPSRIQVDTKPTDISGALFLSIIPEFKVGQPFRFCSRSMTAANNVIIDVRSCITDTGASLASKIIAQSIASKITG
ncbi:sensor domain-containing protein [Mycolicibacterium sp. Y3]